MAAASPRAPALPRCPIARAGRTQRHLGSGRGRQSFRLLAELGQEKIIVFTTHRYDTVRWADRIAVLVDGRLAEMGTHEELVRNTRDFYALYLAQSS